MRWYRVALSAAVFILFSPLTAVAIDVPETVPIPTPRPSSGLSPFIAPVPLPKPLVAEDANLRAESLLAGFPENEEQCRSRLERMGVRFNAVAAVDGRGACGVAYPVTISRLPGGVSLSGKTLLNCRTAEALANWVSESAVPTARRIYGSELVRLDQFASYVCRSRNSQRGTKLSEHAKGNAIDIGRFTLADGTVIDVGSTESHDPRPKRFLKAVRDAGCDHFTTVLGPGSDVYHENHFHFDLAQRRGGYRYCR